MENKDAFGKPFVRGEVYAYSTNWSVNLAVYVDNSSAGSQNKWSSLIGISWWYSDQTITDQHTQQSILRHVHSHKLIKVPVENLSKEQMRVLNHVRVHRLNMPPL